MSNAESANDALAQWIALETAKVEMGEVALEFAPAEMESSDEVKGALTLLAKQLKTTPNTLMKYRKMALAVAEDVADEGNGEDVTTDEGGEQEQPAQ